MMRKYFASQSFIRLDGPQFWFGYFGNENSGLWSFHGKLGEITNTSVGRLREGVLALKCLFLKSRLTKLLLALLSFSFCRMLTIRLLSMFHLCNQIGKRSLIICNQSSSCFFFLLVLDLPFEELILLF